MAAIAAAAAAAPADDDAAPGETVTCLVGSEMYRGAVMADEHAQGALKDEIQRDDTRFYYFPHTFNNRRFSPLSSSVSNFLV